MKYVNNIGKLSSNHSPIESFKHHTGQALEFRELMINQNITAQYLVIGQTMSGGSVNILVPCLIQTNIQNGEKSSL